MASTKIYNRDVDLSGGSRLVKGDTVLIDEHGNIDAPVTTTNLTTSGNTTLGDTSADTLTVPSSTLLQADTQIADNIPLNFGDGDDMVVTYNDPADTVTVDFAGTGCTFSINNNNGLNLVSTDAGTEGPIFTLYQNSASPAADDEVGIISFAGEDDADAQAIYGLISVSIDDASAGAEIGTISLIPADASGDPDSGVDFASDGSTVTMQAINTADTADLELLSGDTGGNVLLYARTGFVSMTGVIQEITDTTAIDAVSHVSTLSNGGAQANGVSDGTEIGQMKVILNLGAGTYTTTPTTFHNGTSLTIPTLSSIFLSWVGATGWAVLGGEGYTVNA